MMLGTLAIATLLVSLTQASLDPRAEFAKFKVNHVKKYASSKEEETRFNIFAKNLEKIERHNSKGHSWRMGVTKFADLSK